MNSYLMSTNEDGENHRLCRTCNPEHVENCSTCFGYGLRKGSNVPLTASSIQMIDVGDWVRCDECKGTPHGRDLNDR